VADPIADLRARVAAAETPREELAPYLAKVRSGAYLVTDDDVEELKRAGLTEDEIFEATVVTATAEGLNRLDAASRVIG
jgi:alkylhydroperoxidase family enzyme